MERTKGSPEISIAFSAGHAHHELGTEGSLNGHRGCRRACRPDETLRVVSLESEPEDEMPRD